MTKKKEKTVTDRSLGVYYIYQTENCANLIGVVYARSAKDALVNANKEKWKHKFIKTKDYRSLCARYMGDRPRERRMDNSRLQHSSVHDLEIPEE